MGLADTIPEEEEEDQNIDTEQNTRVEQKKSLLAHAYSTKADDNYKDISDWEMTQEEVEMVFSMTSPKYGSGDLNDAIDSLPFVASYEEFWNRAALAVAHMLAPSPRFQIREFAEENFDVEPRGATEALELFHISAGDIAVYLQAQLEENPSMARDLRDALNDMDIPEEESEEDEGSDEEQAEPAEADD